MNDMLRKLDKKKIMMLSTAIAGLALLSFLVQFSESKNTPRERISINENWRFFKYDSLENADDLIYDVRPHVKKNWTFGEADDKPTEAKEVEVSRQILKPWILPSGNDFIKDPANLCPRLPADCERI